MIEDLDQDVEQTSSRIGSAINRVDQLLEKTAGMLRIP